MKVYAHDLTFIGGFSATLHKLYLINGWHNNRHSMIEHMMVDYYEWELI